MIGRKSVFVLVLAVLVVQAAIAGTVRAWVNAPTGSYKIELFRVGDPYPSRQYRNV
ncbi:MAG: hypothetical protein JST40_12765 [Armatimonadetes bacterium]|nr:hypothetical protein [Armatimonadota bacterium]